MRQSSSACSHAAPGRRARPALEVRERRLVGRDHPRPRAGLDRHVADRHPLFHRQRRGSPRPRTRARGRCRRPRRAGRSRRGSCPWRVTPGGSVAVEADAHRLRPVCGRHCVASTCSTSDVPMPKASAPNAPCVRRVAVAADDRHARLRQAELRADHVDDALAAAAGREERHAELRAVARAARRAAPCASGSRRPAPSLGRDVVIHRREREVGPARPCLPASRRPSNACGDVTSWTRCRST